MKRYGFWALAAIALTLTGCDRAPDVSETDASQTAADQTAAKDFSKDLPPTPAAQGKTAQPQISTNFSTPVSQKKGQNQPSSASLAASLKQSLNGGRDNPFKSTNQPQVQVTYVNEPVTEARAPLPEVPVVNSVVSSPVATAVPAAPPAPAASVSADNAAAVSPTAIPSASAPTTVQPTALRPAPLVTPVVPPSLPMVVPPVAVPQNVVAVSPAASPTALAESIEIKGIVQIGEQFNIIVRDPNAPTSRTVQVGDVIGGGRVRISRVDSPDSQEPQVVLEQDGVEVVRAVGV